MSAPRLVGWLMVGLACLEGSAVHAALPAAPQAAPAAARLEDTERRVGPYRIADQQFTVVLHEKHVIGDAAPDPEWQTTLAALEIVDAAGAVHYRRVFPYEVSGHEFAEIVSASVRPLLGRQASGVLVTYGVLPSTPLGGRSWQVFGLFERKLVPFSEPIAVEGNLVNADSGDEGVKTSTEPGRQGETLQFRVWTGNFFVVYPVLVDWPRARLTPAWRCSRMTARGPRPVCPFRIEADRVPQEEEPTFVRLHAEADETETPRHVVVRADSKVDLLGSEGEVRWQQDDSGVGLVPGGDFWIKVRIDGREGWIHTQEDLLAIGLPQAG